MFEPSTSRFHPDGLFSEVIFGQIGSTERLVRRGYLELNTKVISPHLFKQMMSLKSYYQDILAGKEYAVFDEELHDFMKVGRDDPDGETGYAFFVKHLSKVVFPQTASIKRSDKIALLKKFEDKLLMTKFIVIPAGVRDVKEDNGRMTSEDINKLYLGLLSLTQAMPANNADDPVFDTIRYQIQMKVQQVYTYLTDLFDGKGGFGQSKYAARSTVYGNRNVITAAPLSRILSPKEPNMFSVDEVLVPIFQAMKGAQPLVINKLKTIFFNQIFSSQTTSIPLIDPKTWKLTYHEVSASEIRKFTTSEGLTDFINGFRNTNIHMTPVTVKTADTKESCYLYLVYDTGDSITPFRNFEDFKQSYSKVDKYTTEGIENFEYVADISPEDYVVIGSTALRAFGMDHNNQDLDVVVSETLFEKIKSDPQFIRLDNGAYHRTDDRVDVYNDVVLVNGLTFTEFKKTHSIRVDRYCLASPEYLFQVYTTSDRIKDKAKIKFLKSIVVNMDNVRPMTYVEMCYMATFNALIGKYATATRHPVLNIEGISLFKTHLVSTAPSRKVLLKGITFDDSTAMVLPEYPLLTSTVKTSMSVHPATLAKYDGDHDGKTPVII